MTDVTFRWHLPYEAPMALAGFAWFARDRVYHRLPRNFPKSFRPDVEELGSNTAGGQIRFQTDSKEIKLKATLLGPHNMDHMTATGQCGFDCFQGAPGAQRFAGVTRFDRGATEYEVVVSSVPQATLRYVTINFPLYHGVKDVQVGLQEGAQLLPPPPYVDDRPIVVYGTSITQGGCASRPGMAYTNILSRMMNRPFINQGYSGNGIGEPEMAEALADIADPALYVLDYEANSHLEGTKKTLAPFIDILRAAHPTVPILVVSKVRYAVEICNPEARHTRELTREVEQQEVARRQAAGDRNITFFDGSTLLGDDFDDCFVDGVHPTDLGFSRMAQGLRPVLDSILTGTMVPG